MSEGFGRPLPYTQHLLCDLHMKEYIMSKMKELGKRGKPSEVILSDIFGREIGCRRVPGLLDSESHTQFVINLGKINEEWLSSHPLSERFLFYFCKYKMGIIRQMMTAELRLALRCIRSKRKMNA